MQFLKDLFESISSTFRQGDDALIESLDSLREQLKEYTEYSLDKLDELINNIDVSNQNAYLLEFVDALTTCSKYLVYGTNSDGIIVISSDNLRFSIGLPQKVNGFRTEEVINMTSTKLDKQY